MIKRQDTAFFPGPPVERRPSSPSPWQVVALAAYFLAGCANSAAYGGGDPCGFSFQDEDMTEAAWCEVAPDATDPCLEVANCLCEARDAEGLEVSFDACRIDEITTGSGFAWFDFCEAPEDMSLAEALRAYTAANGADLTTVGFCEAIYPSL